ncbi:hypothetical protein KO498_11090 [Lentibacter algarum]|uniref:hypothetical protein n=1 Tax=Lentibacter algarum TaxID=576131 RepID=UPI001C069954|nr:hypothetical protein [Lentibacter algarum]MBU2982352.1 hypothetical protein [Lentibacter algarum]
MSFISTPKKRHVLSVCSRKETTDRGPQTSTRNQYSPTSIADLNAARVNVLAPDAVMAWLFCPDYDIFDVAQILTDANYAGQLIALSEPLPNKAMICREVAQRFPLLRFDICCNNTIGQTAKAYHDTIALELA